MPFCRECGKEVQDDWITCPFCSQDIGPPASNTIGLQDSVVMGNVSINDQEILPPKCPKCNSVGIALIACSLCRKTAYCSECKEDIRENRVKRMGQPVHTNQRFGYDLCSKRLCEHCFQKSRESVFRMCPGNCGYYVKKEPYRCWCRGPGGFRRWMNEDE